MATRSSLRTRPVDAGIADVRKLIAGHPFAVLALDESARVVAANRAAERLLDQTAKSLLGEHVDRLFPAACLSDLVASLCSSTSAAGEGANPAPVRVAVQRKHGARITVAVGLEPVSVEGGVLVYASLADATDDVETRSALRDTEARYQSLVESLPLNVLRKDLHGRFTFANRKCLRLMRRSLEDLVGKTDFDLFPPDLAKKYRADDTRVITTGEVFEDVEEHQGPNGRKSYVQVLKAPLLNARGEIVGIQGMFWDVSPRKRAEQGLLESEARKRSVLEAALDAIVMARDDGTIVEFNPAAERTFGHLAEAVYGKNLVDTLFPDGSRERIRAVVNGLCDPTEREGDGPSESERFAIEAARSDGSTFVAEVSLRLIPVEERPALVVFVRDVTERHRAQAAIERERFLLHSLMDNVPDNVYFKDREGRYLRINKAKARQSGVGDPEAAVGRTDFDFFPEEHARQAREDELEVMRTGRPIVGKDERLTWPDGTVTWSSTTKVPLRNERGEIVGTFGISRDVTDHKRAEVALREAADAADAANRAKSDFLANTSHEIRTPMNAIIGMTELLLDDEELTGRQREFLGIVRDSAESLLDVINDILDFSKIEAGHVELDDDEFGVADVLGDTMKSLAIRAHRKGLELAFHCGRDVPRCVRGDAARLRQIVVNLVGNAIKFTEEGEVLLDVACRSRTGDGVVLHLSVRDTGIGIAPEKLEKIFEAFEQADTSTSRRYGGTGLGLAISSKLVELLGGRIWAESEEGVGSAFHFTVPLGIGDPSSIAAPASETLRGLRVLVVDDNLTNRRIVDEMLRAWEMEPRTVGSADEAVAALRAAAAEERPFAVVLSDVNMPDRDGFAIVEHVRSEPALANTALVMLTSGDRPEDVDRCEALGVEQYLIKPVKQSELFNAIGSAVGARNVVEPRRPVAPVEEPPLQPLRILLAEDSLPNQKLAVRLLERWGHEVTVCENGVQAVNHVREGRIDLVLMDVQMPEMDGLEATRVIREWEATHGGHVPIVAMTAHAMAEDRERCLESGMDDYVSKPIRAPLLRRAIAEVTASPTESDPSSAAGASGSPTARERLMDWREGLDIAGGDPELLLEVAAAFLEEKDETVAALEAALEEGDAAGAAHWAHRLKGGFRSIAATPLLERAEALEAAARGGDVERARELAGDLLGHVPTLIAEIEHARERGVPQE